MKDVTALPELPSNTYEIVRVSFPYTSCREH